MVPVKVVLAYYSRPKSNYRDLGHIKQETKKTRHRRLFQEVCWLEEKRVATFGGGELEDMKRFENYVNVVSACE